MSKSKSSLKEEILLALSVSLGALFFATAITLIIARFYKKIRACCDSCCPVKSESTSSFFGSNNNKKPAVPYEKLVERRKEAAIQTPVRRMPPAFLQTSENQFTIPGGFYASSIQPELKVTSSSGDNIDSRTSSTNSRVSPYRQRRLTESVNSLPASFSPNSAKCLARPNSNATDEDSGSLKSEEKLSLSLEDMTSTDFRPELYNIERQRTLGIGHLGKAQLSLQYEDKSRKRLNIFLRKLSKLQIIRPDIANIYASILLLPEREAIYTTKQHKVSTAPVFEEKFVFASRPMNRDFESKTALLLIHYVDKSSKDIVYGEARLPLLCKEIYSQVLTDVALNIKVASMQSECGDILVQLIYNDQGTLHVMVKTVKVPPINSLENMSALQVKCYLKRLGNRVGKKTLLSKSLPGPNVATLDVNGECKFKIPRENFTDFDLTCAVSSKHKIIGKKLLLGKAVIGGNSKDDTGVSHWKTISHSPGIAWTVWHPIYNN